MATTTTSTIRPSSTVAATPVTRPNNKAMYWGIAAAVIAILAILYAISTSRNQADVSSSVTTPATDSMMTDTPPTTVPSTLGEGSGNGVGTDTGARGFVAPGSGTSDSVNATGGPAYGAESGTMNRDGVRDPIDANGTGTSPSNATGNQVPNGQ